LSFNIAKLLQFGMQALNVILALLACEADSSIQHRNNGMH